MCLTPRGANLTFGSTTCCIARRSVLDRLSDFANGQGTVIRISDNTLGVSEQPPENHTAPASNPNKGRPSNIGRPSPPRLDKKTIELLGPKGVNRLNETQDWSMYGYCTEESKNPTWEGTTTIRVSHDNNKWWILDHYAKEAKLATAKEEKQEMDAHLETLRAADYGKDHPLAMVARPRVSTALCNVTACPRRYRWANVFIGKDGVQWIRPYGTYAVDPFMSGGPPKWLCRWRRQGE